MSDPTPPPQASRIGFRAKICGLTRREDAAYAAGAGAGFLGAVLVPESPRALSPRQAREVVAGLDVPTVAVMADVSLEEASSSAEVMGAGVVQLHGEESPEYVARLWEMGPWQVWKALRVRKGADVPEGVARYGSLVQGLLLDGWHPNQRGGTGTSFPWEEVERVRGLIPPGILLVAAGGLDPSNVAEVLQRLRPDIVDVSSGVEESPGIKDHSCISQFIQEVQRAEKAEGR